MKYKHIVESVRLKEQLKTRRGADLMRKKKEQQRNIEHHVADMIDHKNALLSLQEDIRKLANTRDVQSFIQDISPALAVELAKVAMQGESEKVRFEALKDLLDRAGYGKVQKHAVARFSANDSKEAIIASIMGSKKELEKQGIEIVDDDEDQAE